MKNLDEFLGKIDNKKLLVVFPHPDDESVMAGGLIQRAMKLGYLVTVLTLTEGDRGRIHINGKGRSVSEIRRQEMAVAMSRLGVSDWIMWKFADGKLKRLNNWRVRLKMFLEETQPGVIVTYDLSGVSGHPDHIVLSKEIIRYVRVRKDIELLWPSFEGKTKERVVSGKVRGYLNSPDVELKMSLAEAVKKWYGAFAHESQGLKGFVGWSWWILVFVARREFFSLFDRKRKYKYRYIKFKI